ncbi:reverse transcriptase domain-containing protein [Tanacetum coccineum]
MILNLPSLTTPVPKETLYIYIAASKEALSAMLLAEQKGNQCPVQRLRRYNEAHPIKVNTDQPIKQILNKAKTFEKLAKYFVPAGSDALVPRRTPYMIDQQTDCKEEWVLYTDGASSIKGSRAGLVLIGPTKTKYTYAMRLNFTSTNNQAEYEALLAGLRITKKMKAKEYIRCFKKFKIKNIPRNQNQKADVLSKLALVAFNHLTKEILVKVLETPSTDRQEINVVVEEERDNWMTPIVKCLEEGKWLEDLNEARTLKMKIHQYVMEEGVLFKRSHLMHMLRCMGSLQANYVIREIHMGACSMHLKARSVVAKAIRYGYYRQTIHHDAKEEIRKCDSCQIYSPVAKLPKTLMTSIMASWPFFQ